MVKKVKLLWQAGLEVLKSTCHAGKFTSWVYVAFLLSEPLFFCVAPPIGMCVCVCVRVSECVYVCVSAFSSTSVAHAAQVCYRRSCEPQPITFPVLQMPTASAKKLMELFRMLFEMLTCQAVCLFLCLHNACHSGKFNCWTAGCPRYVIIAVRPTNRTLSFFLMLRGLI